MKPLIEVGLALAAVVLPASVFASTAAATSQSSGDLVKAVARGDCNAAVRMANDDLKLNDAQAIFLVGRMLAEGVCVQPDVAAATPYFAHAASQGLAAAQIEYGLQVGLGEGADQSYERAGNLCRKGGLEQQGGSSSQYSLGYVCTLRGLVSRRLRESLPRGAFVPDTGVAQLSFNPATGAMQVRATPRVAMARDTATGSIVRHPLFDAQATIDKAWRDAMSAVPKPDASRLDDQRIDVTLDLDMTIDGRTDAALGEQRLPQGFMLPGEVHPVMH